MRKLIVLLALVAGICVAETGSIAAGGTSVAFTNSTSAQRLYIYNVAVKTATAVADTYSVQVTKGGTDFQIGTVSTTTNTVNGNAVITNKILVGPSGVYKVVRSDTNYVANVFIDIRD